MEATWIEGVFMTGVLAQQHQVTLRGATVGVEEGVVADMEGEEVGATEVEEEVVVEDMEGAEEEGAMVDPRHSE